MKGTLSMSEQKPICSQITIGLVRDGRETIRAKQKQITANEVEIRKYNIVLSELKDREKSEKEDPQRISGVV
jgi:hypothetical protein